MGKYGMYFIHANQIIYRYFLCCYLVLMLNDYVHKNVKLCKLFQQKSSAVQPFIRYTLMGVLFSH